VPAALSTHWGRGQGGCAIMQPAGSPGAC
jgi:hypothetical protein